MAPPAPPDTAGHRQALLGPVARLGDMLTDAGDRGKSLHEQLARVGDKIVTDEADLPRDHPEDRHLGNATRHAA